MNKKSENLNADLSRKRTDIAQASDSCDSISVKLRCAKKMTCIGLARSKCAWTLKWKKQNGLFFFSIHQEDLTNCVTEYAVCFLGNTRTDDSPMRWTLPVSVQLHHYEILHNNNWYGGMGCWEKHNRLMGIHPECKFYYVINCRPVYTERLRLR